MMNLRNIAYSFALPIKNLKTTAISTPAGIRVTLPNLDNKTIDIENAL